MPDIDERAAYGSVVPSCVGGLVASTPNAALDIAGHALDIAGHATMDIAGGDRTNFGVSRSERVSAYARGADFRLVALEHEFNRVRVPAADVERDDTEPFLSFFFSFFSLFFFSFFSLFFVTTPNPSNCDFGQFSAADGKSCLSPLPFSRF